MNTTYRPNTHTIPRGRAARNILLAYLGLFTVLCTGATLGSLAYIEAHSTVVLPIAYELIEEEEDGEAVEGTDSGVGCVDDCLDPGEGELGESTLFDDLFFC